MPPQAANCMEHSFPFPEALPQPAGAKVKCVLVGDGAIGKTSLVVSYTTNGYPTEYVPTAFDNYSVVVTVDNRPIRLQLCDTAGQDDFDTLRPLCYPSTDVFLLCFSVVSPTSFHNITEKWIREIRTNAPKTPIILVGTQSDLRNDVRVLIELANYNERPITEAEAKTLADDIGAIAYIECSALTQKNLKHVFDTAIVSALGLNKQLKRSKSRKSFRKTSKKYEHPEKRTVSRDSAALVKKGWKRFCCFL